MCVRDNKKESILPYFCRQCFVTSSTTSPKWFLSELVNDITQSMVQSTVILIVISTAKNDKDNGSNTTDRICNDDTDALGTYLCLGIYFQISGFATVLSDRSAYLLRFTILVHSYYVSQSTLFVSTILASMNPPTSLETQMSVMINACIIALLASDITWFKGVWTLAQH